MYLFVTFRKEMNEKLARPGELRRAGDHSTRDNFFPHKLSIIIIKNNSLGLQVIAYKHGLFT